MSTRSREERRPHVEEEAEGWLEAIERSLKPHEVAPLRAWLKDGFHRDVIVARCKLWHGPEILAVLRELVPVETFASRVEKQYGRMVLAIFLAVSGMGFATVIIAVSKHLPGSDEHGNPLRARAHYTTVVGERKSIALPGGGTIRLNTATQLLLDYGPLARDITLISGEASFDVTSDEERPIRVYADPRRLVVQPGRAQFNLRKLASETVAITVSAGQIVALASSRRDPLSPALIRARASQGERSLTANETAVLGRGWQVARAVSEQELQRDTAWQDGRLVFSDEPLEDALHEIERYTTTRFSLADAQLSRARVTGEFPIGGVDDLRRHLFAKLNIASQVAVDGESIVLMSAKRAATGPEF